MGYTHIALVLVATIIGAFGAINLKIASGRIKSIRTVILNRRLIMGFFFYGLATVLFIPALKGGKVSVIYPLVSLTYIWVCLLSVRMLDEKMSPRRWAALALIIIGISIISIDGALI